MSTAYTTLLRLAKPATGELSGTWGDTVNQGITDLVDAAIAGRTSIAMADANYTLSTANGAADESRYMMLNMTGALTANRAVICPTLSKLYIVKNATTGGHALLIQTVAGSGVYVENGETLFLACDGTNVVNAFSTINANVTGNLTGNISVSTAGAGSTYVALVDSTGSQAVHLDGGLFYDTSTNNLTATTFTGSLAGNASTATSATSATTATTATTATNATNVNAVDAGADTTTWVALVGTQTGNTPVLSDAGLTYNSSTNNLTATTFTGSLAGNASTATSATSATSATTATTATTANAVAAANITSYGGAYTPTITALGNCSAVSVISALYTLVGKMCNVTVSFSVTRTATGTMNVGIGPPAGGTLNSALGVCTPYGSSQTNAEYGNAGGCAGLNGNQASLNLGGSGTLTGTSMVWYTHLQMLLT